MSSLWVDQLKSDLAMTEQRKCYNRNTNTPKKRCHVSGYESSSLSLGFISLTIIKWDSSVMLNNQNQQQITNQERSVQHPNCTRLIHHLTKRGWSMGSRSWWFRMGFKTHSIKGMACRVSRHIIWFLLSKSKMSSTWRGIKYLGMNPQTYQAHTLFNYLYFEIKMYCKAFS